MNIKNNSLVFKFPEIAREFHPYLNKNVILENLTYGSTKKVWWKCEHDHEWQVSINTRTNIGTNCPYCSGKLATFENNLAVKFPELLKEWDYEKNVNLDPENILPQSHKKVWWKCFKDSSHEWQASVGDRTAKYILDT